MSCIIYTAKLPWLYDLVVREANAAYRRYAGGEPYLHFVLCYKNKVVIFQPDWEPTEAQMLSAGRIFQK